MVLWGGGLYEPRTGAARRRTSLDAHGVRTKLGNLGDGLCHVACRDNGDGGKDRSPRSHDPLGGLDGLAVMMPSARL